MNFKVIAQLSLILLFSFAFRHAEIRKPKVIKITTKDFKTIKKIIAKAEDGDIIQFKKYNKIFFPEALVITKRLIIKNLYVEQKSPNKSRNPEKKEKFNLLVIDAIGVELDDFELHGYYQPDLDDGTKDHNYEEDQHALIWVKRGGFKIQNGTLSSSLKDGLRVTPDNDDINNPVHINGGIIKNIKGSNNHKNLISIGGAGAYGLVKNITIEDIECERSRDKGAVAISDGTRNITVKNLKVEKCIYAINIQDHYNPDDYEKAKQDYENASKNDDTAEIETLKQKMEKEKAKQQGTNKNISIDEVYAKNCIYGIKTSNHDLNNINLLNDGHDSLKIKNTTLERCLLPIMISNTKNVMIKDTEIIAKGVTYNFRNDDFKELENYKKKARIQIDNCALPFKIRKVEIKRCHTKRANISYKNMDKPDRKMVNIKSDKNCR